MNILLLGSVAQSGRAVLESRLAEMPRGAEITLTDAFATDPRDTLAGKFAAADMIVCPAYTAGYPDAPRLKMLHAPNAGLDSIDFDALPDGAAVCNVFEHDIGIGDYVMAGMLRFTVELEARSERFKALDWQDTPRLGATPRRELKGARVLTIGYGSIGQEICRRAHVFGMQVDAVTRTPRDFDVMPDRMTDYAGLPGLMAEADFIIVACPLTDETEGLVDAALLSRAKPDAVLINVARGPIVDQHALYDCLVAGGLRGAVLDTWYHYPNPGDSPVKPADVPLWELENVVVTPHCSGWTAGLIERRFGVIAENAHNLLTGSPLINQVWPE